MPKLEHSTRPRDVDDEYYYRRPLRLRELLPALGVGIAVGFFAFYVTRVFLQRTPLEVERRPRARRIALEKAADA
jgi:hypothetical protein